MLPPPTVAMGRAQPGTLCSPISPLLVLSMYVCLSVCLCVCVCLSTCGVVYTRRGEAVGLELKHVQV